MGGHIEICWISEGSQFEFLIALRRNKIDHRSKKGCAMLALPVWLPTLTWNIRIRLTCRNYFFWKSESLFSPILILEMEGLSQTVSVWQIFFRLNQTFGLKSFINQSTVNLFSVMKNDFFLFYKHSQEQREFSSGWIYKLEEHGFHDRMVLFVFHTLKTITQTFSEVFNEGAEEE